MRALRGSERALERLARRGWLAILLVGALSLIGRAVLLPVLPIPRPAIQDEFSYLLAADTFAHGRLANPSHPMAEHFETLQELMWPTYSSKYPPLAGLVLAFGQKVLGNPWLAQWLSMAILCGAICWALQGWLPPLWALIGSLMALARMGIVSYWTESYWGGAYAAIGGAFLIGSIPRLVRRPRLGPALVFAVGLAILANTRPYEGLVFAIVCAAYAVIALVRRHGFGPCVKAFVLPAAILLMPVLAWMMFYNYRVTGSALLMPYQLHERQYAVWTPFLWQKQATPAPAYNDDFFRKFWVEADGKYKQFEREHWLKVHVYDFFKLDQFFLGIPLLLCIVLCSRAIARNRKGRIIALIGVAFYLGLAVEGRLVAHYVAPATVIVYFLAATSLRIIRSHRQFGLYSTYGVLVLFVVIAGARLLTPANLYEAGTVDYHRGAKRELVLERLKYAPGQQLVFVRYGPKHDYFEELVYNTADIDSQRIVWARSLGAQRDLELMHYYPGRRAWIAVEDGGVKMRPYSEQDLGTMTPVHGSTLH